MEKIAYIPFKDIRKKAQINAMTDMVYAPLPG